MLAESETGFENVTSGKPKSPSIGIDLGLISLIATSNGESIEAPKFLRKGEKRIKLLQRRVSKKVKGSKNRAKARLRLAKAHEVVANQRRDFLHKLSRRLVNENQVVYAENLSVKNMVKNHHLAKSISDSGWSELLRQIDYKGNLVKIGRFARSTGVCKDCHLVGPKLELSVREWTCECGCVNDRDISAAIQIKKLGESLDVGQELPESKPVEKLTSAKSLRTRKQVGSVKQESSSVERKAS
jgi:putative transposase